VFIVSNITSTILVNYNHKLLNPSNIVIENFSLTQLKPIRLKKFPS